MPQGGSKKKKGRGPAHQNTFAYKHNPKSKKTEAILNSPNVHVCRRCHDKIEWRKKYRKYKPLSQPSNCNLCDQRNVKAAYHTICKACTTSDSARMAVLNNRQDESRLGTEVVPDNELGGSEGLSSDPTIDQQDKRTSLSTEIYRVCAVCAKEPALRCEDNELQQNDEMLLVNGAGRLRLREKRAIERKKTRQLEEKKRAERDARSALKGDEREGGQIVEGESIDIEKMNGDESSEQHPSDGNEEEHDPFLKAVGGAEKLLTGEAYQKMMLEKEVEET